MNDTSIGIDAIVRVIDQATAPIRGINASISRLTSPLKGVGQALGRIGNEAGLPRLVGGFKNVGVSVGRLGSEVRGLLGPITAIGGAGSLAGIYAAIDSFTDYGSVINDTTRKIGVGVEGFQELSYAAKLSGIEQESLAGALSKANRTIADIGRGKNKEGAALFKQLGINVRDANGHLRTADQVTLEAADAISKLRDPAARTAVAISIFGKSGADLLPLLLEGSGGIKSMGEEARRLGIVLSKDAIAAADEFGDTQDKLNLSIKGLSLNIGSVLVPILQPLVASLTDWIAANRQVISTNIGSFVEAFATSLKSIDWSAVIDGLKSFFTGIKSAVDFLGGWRNAIVAVIAVMNAGLIGSILGVGASLVKLVPAILQVSAVLVTGLIKSITALSSFLFANPIVAGIALAVAAIAGLAYVIYKNWDNIVEFFLEKFSDVRAAFQDGFLNGIGKILLEFNPTVLIAEGINGLIDYLFGINLFEIGANWFGPFVTSITGLIDGLVESIVGKIKQITGFIGDTISSFRSIGSGISNFFTGGSTPNQPAFAGAGTPFIIA